MIQMKVDEKAQFYSDLMKNNEFNFKEEEVEENAIVYRKEVRFPDGVRAELTVYSTHADENGNGHLYAYMTWFTPIGEEIDSSEPDEHGFLGEWGYAGDDEHPDYGVNVVVEHEENITQHNKIELQWGLPIDSEDALIAAWGARAIMHGVRDIEFLPDRQDAFGIEDDKKLLVKWVKRHGIPTLRRQLTRSKTEYAIDQGFFHLKASVRWEYICISAWMIGMKEFPVEGKWSGNFVPEVGERVEIPFNDLGRGKVIGYFKENGWTGCIVRLSRPPAWHKKQCPGQGISGVFGAEIRSLRKGR